MPFENSKFLFCFGCQKMQTHLATNQAHMMGCFRCGKLRSEHEFKEGDFVYINKERWIEHTSNKFKCLWTLWMPVVWHYIEERLRCKVQLMPDGNIWLELAEDFILITDAHVLDPA